MPEFTGIDSLSAGDILLYRSTTLFGWAIRELDDSEVSHAAIYLGDEVAEALVREGLTQRSVQKSVEGCPWVAVMRKHPIPGPMTPVMNVAQKYLDQGNRYGYFQILLLAGICLTRKVDLSNPLLRKLVRTAMSKSVDMLGHLHSEGKEPMICSEFVFRTYNEALLETDDLYSIEILSQAVPEPRRCFSRVRRLFGRLEAPANESAFPTVHPESLLGRLEASGETTESLSASGMLKLAQPPVDDDLDLLIEQYKAEVEGEKVGQPLAVSADSEVTDDELLDTARIFATELLASAGRSEEIEKTLYGAPAETAERTAPTLNEIFADFVTPGDLLQSPSLERVGTIEP